MKIQVPPRPDLKSNYRQVWDYWSARLLDLVYPPQCVACRTALADGAAVQICDLCHEALFNDEIVPCFRCGGRISVNPYIRHCRLCRGERFYFERAMALGNYRGRLREVVYQLKRRDQEPIAFQLGRQLGLNCLQSLKVDADFNCVAPMPSHRIRQWTRGMNPAAVISEGVAQEARVELIPDLLQTRRVTEKQGTLSRTARLANVKDSMRVNPRIDVSGLRVLLVDDVMASGATANEAARMLRGAGVKKVIVGLVARGMGNN